MPSKFVIAVALFAVLAAGAFWFMPERFQHSDRSAEIQIVEDDAVSKDDSLSPFAVQEELETDVSAVDQSDNQSVENVAATAPDSALNYGPVDVTSLGRESLSDADLLLLVAQLKADPQLLQQLIDEFRQSIDPDRKQRLADILSQVGGDDVTLLASELIFSGDEQSRDLGLALLRQLQPNSEQAREIVSSMLSTEVEPSVLTGTLSALATPGDVDEASKAYLANQVSLLTSHSDPSVRGVSLDILSRWSSGDEYVPVLLGGLSDSSRAVRTAAGYALGRYAGSDPDVIRHLFEVAGDLNEHERARRAAISALKSQPLSQEQLDEIAAIELRLNQK